MGSLSPSRATFKQTRTIYLIEYFSMSKPFHYGLRVIFLFLIFKW